MMQIECKHLERLKIRSPMQGNENKWNLRGDFTCHLWMRVRQEYWRGGVRGREINDDH